MRHGPLLAAGLLLLGPPAPPRPEKATRRIAIRAPEGVSVEPELERFSGWGRRQGIEVQAGPEDAAVPPGWESARVAVLPVSEAFRRLVAKFPLRLTERGFVFDGRSYGRPEDAIALSDPARSGEVFVLGNARRTVLRLLARRLFYGEDDRGEDYRVISGDLVKSGRFARGSPLVIERASDRDDIKAMESFYRSLRQVQHGSVRWRFRESEASAVSRWEPVLRRFLGNSPARPLVVVAYPDAATKGRYTGSSRPADLSLGEEMRIDLDFSSPGDPDLITPALASAAWGAREKRLLSRPVLLAALGARSAGRWWGRDVAGFAAFTRRARVEPSVAEVVSEDAGMSPVLGIGAAASWIDAGMKKEGEEAVLHALSGPAAALERALRRWSALAGGVAASPPARRPLPDGFLRGISYAMSNSTEASYASPRSLETLARIAKMSADSISIMPFAFLRDARSPGLDFIHRHPGGETDEGIVRAVSDARGLGMSAMVKPQIWVGGGRFVGDVAMGSEEEWRRFFEAYRRFIVHHAVVADVSGAALFCVGTEMVGTESRVREWRETIASVRLATGAPLLYAANWAAGAPKVAFWDALDAIGVDFYDPLSNDPGASDDALESGAAAAVAPLAALAQASRKPVIFTEAGYPGVRGAWIAPHDENSGRPPAAADAARAIAAVFRALEGKAWWKGVYWWKTFSGGQAARENEAGYNLLGTPAEKAIAEGFSRLRHNGNRP